MHPNCNQMIFEPECCKQKTKNPEETMWFFPGFKCAPGEARTLNLLIRSQALYPLSYGGSIRIIHEDFFPCLSDELQGKIGAFTL